MTLPIYKYDNILNLLTAGIPYRIIADIENVSPTTICKSAHRYHETGCIFPPRERKSVYNATEQLISKRIRYYLAILTTDVNYRCSSKVSNQLILRKLEEEGFQGSSSMVKRLVKLERNRLKESFLDIYYEPSVMCQFDWGQKRVTIDGCVKTVYFAVFALPYSNYRKVYITKNMNSKSFLSAFQEFTSEMNGVFPILLIDNMRIAARSNIHAKKRKQLTKLFLDLSEFYGFEARLCTPYRPNQKGTVENAVKTLKYHISKSSKQYASLVEFQQALNILFDDLNHHLHSEKNDSCYQLMLQEKAHLIKLPKKQFVYNEEIIRTVRNNTLVRFENNFYSVPEPYRGEKIIVRYTAKVVRIVSLEGQVIAKYARCHGMKKKRYRVWNMINKLKIKHHGFENSKEFRSMPPWLHLLYQNLFAHQAENFIAFLEIVQGLKQRTVRRIINKFNADKSNFDMDTLLGSFLRC